METTTAAAPALTEIALAKSDERVSVSANGVVLGTVKNAEKILKAHGILRATGYSLQDGALVASGVRV